MPLVDPKGRDGSVVTRQIKSVFRLIKAGAKKNVSANFYIVGNKDDFSMVVFISKKDRSGSKTMREGKNARKALKGGKWGRGIAFWDGSRFVFELANGNLSKQNAKDILRNKLAKESELAFLKRSVVVEPSEDIETSIEQDKKDDIAFRTAIGEEDTLSVELTQEEQSELGSLSSDQNLTDMRRSLSNFLTLSEESAEEKIDNAMDDLSSLLTQLESAPENKALEEQLQKKQREILELVDFGPSVFKTVPGVIEDAGMLLNLTAADMGTAALEQRLKDINDDFEEFLDNLGEDDTIEQIVQRRQAYERLTEDVLEQLEKITCG